MERWRRATLEMREGALLLTVETDCGAQSNIGECRSITLYEVANMKGIKPADAMLMMFRNDQTRDLAAAFIREIRRFCG